eukprot:UN24394
MCIFLHELIEEKQKSNDLWKDLTCIFNDCNIPGEGEHKIQDYLRCQENSDPISMNENHVIYGRDADLFLLSMVRKQSKIYILRDERTDRFGEWLLCDTNKMNKLLARELTNCNMEDDIQRNKVLADFVLIASFLGNDFVPGLMSTCIHYDMWAIEHLITSYAILYYKTKFQTITDEKKIHVKRLRQFFEYTP